MSIDWFDVKQLLTRPGPFVFPGWEPNPDAMEQVHGAKILVVGAGGLGCELLKDLALSGFQDIHVIDMDTIDVSNLNRQFLFRKKDVGRFKAEVAAEFVMNRVEGVKITHHVKRLETFDSNFYGSFNVVIAGLDNVEARRWLNSMLVSLVKFDDEGAVNFFIPFIDGGTEAFRGQARLFLPHVTSCYECSVAALPQQKGFARCTLANVPRIPEHCISYAREKLWATLEKFESSSNFQMYVPKHNMDEFEPQAVRFDADDPEHMSWVFHRAVERANQYKITGVTYELTMQVVKNIIPAIASTNALIAAACVNETLKAVTYASLNLSNYFMYMGDNGTYTRTFDYEKNPECTVCGSVPLRYELDKTCTLNDLILKLKNDPALKLKNPSISVGSKAVYLSAKMFADDYKSNLEMSIEALFPDNSELAITDKEVLGKKNVRIHVRFVEGKFVEVAE